jgi:hypothetical protein
MRYVRVALVAAAVVFAAGAVFAQGTESMWYIGPFEGEVTVKDGQTPGPPGYYYRPEATEYPTFSERYDHPVRCRKCYRWRDMGERCDWCGLPADRYEQSQARRGAVYSPRPIPGQYYYDRPMRSTTGPKHKMGWPYLNKRYSY